MEQNTVTEPQSNDDEIARDVSGLRRWLTLSWVGGIVAFTLLRFVVARETLEGYGLNIWLFGFIDLITAVPYALGVAKVVGAMVDRDLGGVSKWGAVAAISFLAPYAYIAIAGRDASFPGVVYAVLVLLIAIFGGNAIWNIRRKVREGRSGGVVSAA